MVDVQQLMDHERLPANRTFKVRMPTLIEKIARDADVEAFQKLFEEFAPRVKALLMRQGSDPATAEEIAQETMLTVWRKASFYSQKRGSVSTWIFTIARNHSIDRFRKQASWRAVDEDLTLHEANDMPADEIVMQRQTEQSVRTVLKDLPEEQRLVIDLSYSEGLSHGEISEKLGIPLGTVKSRMRLAYKRIRATIEDEA